MERPERARRRQRLPALLPARHARAAAPCTDDTRARRVAQHPNSPPTPPPPLLRRRPVLHTPRRAPRALWLPAARRRRAAARRRTLARTPAAACEGQREATRSLLATREGAGAVARRVPRRRVCMCRRSPSNSSQPLAKKVASALALLAPPGTKLAHSARVRTIKHRIERWRPLECPRRAAPAAAKECFGERTNQLDELVTPKN